MAIVASVTVSIGELMSGTVRRIRRVRFVLTSTCEGTTSLNRGSSNTSSNVIPCSEKISAGMCVFSFLVRWKKVETSHDPL